MLKFKKFIIKVIATMGIFITVQQVQAEVDDLEPIQQFNAWFTQRASESNQYYNPGKLSAIIIKEREEFLEDPNNKGACIRDADVFAFKKVLDNQKELAQQSDRDERDEYVCMTSAYETWEKLNSLGIESYILWAESGRHWSHFAVLYKADGKWFVADLCFATWRSSQETDEDHKKAMVAQHLKETPLAFIQDTEKCKDNHCGAKLWCYFDPSAQSPRPTKNIFELVPDVKIYLRDRNYLCVNLNEDRVLEAVCMDGDYSTECCNINGCFIL
ncbi:MAG: hypothetical protein LBF82_00220 [Lactobacillales bacterium]|jgi:hypothetical protein|nr:hypothetical protein [Lactobacillales bacterium]